MRLDSYIFEIPNFLNIFEKNISKRIYRGKDPFNDLTLFSPTYRQLKIMQNELYINNNFYKSIANLLEKIEGKILFDVGANIGYYSRTISHFCNKEIEIIGIEPDLHNLGFCSMNLRDRENCTLFHGGLSNNFNRYNLSIPDYAKFRKGESKFNSGLLSAVGGASKNGIRFINFDDYRKLMQINFDDIAWIKIDVEGFELNVLKGMEDTLLNSKPIVEIELNPNTMILSNETFNDYLNYFSKFEYVPLKPKDYDLNDSDSKLFGIDLLFVKGHLISLIKDYFDYESFSEKDILNWHKLYKKLFFNKSI